MNDLSGRTALVTGGGSGAGAAIAMAFAEAGAKVWVAGRSEERLREITAKHEAISGIAADVTDEQSVKSMFAAAGPCDVIIANAGAAESAPFAKTDLDAWQRMIGVNLTGVFLTLREGLRQMPEQGGRLIAVASTAGLKGYAYVAPYAAAKHGVIGLVRSLALEIAKKKITVNAICPGFMDTEMSDRSVANVMKKTGMNEADARAALTRFNPQGRLIQPLEVAETALWLCGDGAVSVNGQAIALSGGEV
ncbi:MAG: SDR family NAD(P)-dependent oxidoreductase [Rhodospirillales bacterium]|nr:SDR family NAD(P)-dependent oxidoreductase [Rhodospirillales bacterium]